MDYEVDKRVRILNAAAEQIISAGLQAPMSAIANAAGVATGSLYNYFPSKDELIIALYRRVAEALSAEMIGRIDTAAPHRQRVELYVRAYVAHIWHDPIRAALYEVITNSPLIMQDKVGGLFREFAAYSTSVLTPDDGPKSTGLSPYLSASFVRGAIRNTLKRHRATGSELTDDMTTRLVEMCIAALAA